MNKLYFVIACVCFLNPFNSRAQNVIVSEDFEGDLANIAETLPSGTDQGWIDADFDAIPDASGASRPGAWFQTFGFADVDSNDLVLASNAWTENPTPVANYIILPPIHFNDASGMLYWKSAPFQTPKFLDGLQVLVSITGNFDSDFSDTLMHYAEYISGDPGLDSSFSNYTFSPGFIFGADGQYIQYDGDSMRFNGILRPDSASLADYAGMDIYIAFCHGTTDDNLMSIDDIIVTGNGSFVAVSDPSLPEIGLHVFPNPATDVFSVDYTLANTTQIQLDLFDINGRMVQSISNAVQIKGQYQFNVDIRNLAAGNYSVVLKTSQGESAAKLTKL